MPSHSPAAPKQYGAEHKPRQLSDDLSDTEHLPRVKLGLFLSFLEDVSVCDEFRLRLHHDAGSNKYEVEQSKHPVLEIGVSVSDVPVASISSVQNLMDVCLT